MLLSAFDTQGRILFGGPLPVKKLRLAYAEPAHSARYREFYDVPVLFGQGVTAVEFESALLSSPIGFADPATVKLAERLCAEQLNGVAGNGSVVERTRQVLDAARTEPPNLERVARTLQVSGRTLRRNLKRVGTSYQRILDAWRRERADDWLLNTHLSQHQMAQKLGFSDVRSFRRAYKRWTGQSPSAPRARK
jgi:AraC-like DNA-binding protein